MLGGFPKIGEEERMFGRKSAVVLVQEPLVPIRVERPVPISLEAELKEEEKKQYAKLCDEIGFRPAALIKEELLAFLQEKQLRVYPYQGVKEYLDAQFGKKDRQDWGHTWGWCPLREADQSMSDLPARNFNNDNGGFSFNRTYHGAIPFGVLDSVKQLISAVPGLHFFVSDIMRPQDRSGDPFLAVSAPGMAEMIVIAAWDEPSFRS
ncbi:MAG: hypothetical protein Q7R73_02600 [bacterium]|nr:hypothetical protein [bacterium]